MNISLAFELNGPVTDELLLKAWSLVKKEYPYFSSSITQDKTGQLVFVPPTKSQVRTRRETLLGPILSQASGRHADPCELGDVMTAADFECGAGSVHRHVH